MTTDDGARPHPGADLRLFPAALGVWLATWWATAQGARPVLLVAGLGAGCVPALLIVLGLGARSRRRSQPRWLVAVAVVTMITALAAAVLAVTGLRLLSRQRDPLTIAARSHGSVAFTGKVIDDPRQLATPSLGGDERWAVRIAVRDVSEHGRSIRSSAQLVALGSRPWGTLVAGNQIHGWAKLEPSQAGDQEAALAFPRGAPQVLDRGTWLWRAAEDLRVGLRNACQGLPADAQGLLPALVVGDTSHLSPRLRTDLQAAGLTHLTAVSGENVAILAAVVVATIAALGGGIRMRVAGTALAIVGFVVLARPEPSVLRAAVMGGLALVGLLLSRRGAGAPLLAATAMGLLFADPWLSRSFGFVLSVLATAGLLILVPLWLDHPHRLPRPVLIAVAVPLAAQLVTAPVTVLLNPSVSLVAVPANLLVEVAVAPATVAGVIAAAVSVIWPSGAHLVAFGGGLATEWIALVAHRAAAFPGGSVVWPAGLKGGLLLGSITVVGVLLSLRRAWLPLLLCLVLVASCLAVPHWVSILKGGAWPPADWIVVQCDVGQGSSTLIRSGADQAVIIDTGPDPGLVDNCLRRTGITRLDLMVITHDHADHAGGITGALRGRGNPPIIVSPLAEPADQARKVAIAAAGLGRRPVIGTSGMSGVAGTGAWAVRWLVLPPPRSASLPALGSANKDDGTRINNASLVVAAEVQGLHVMALGDVEPESQQPLISTILADEAPDPAGAAGMPVSPVGPLAPVDVVIVAHHGSARQLPRLYQLLKPRVALIGVGLGNDYGHPAPSTVTMLKRVGAVVLRTDLQGQLAVAGRSGHLRVATST